MCALLSVLREELLCTSRLDQCKRKQILNRSSSSSSTAAMRCSEHYMYVYEHASRPSF
jgi:hypothetical protein